MLGGFGGSWREEMRGDYDHSSLDLCMKVSRLRRN